MDEQQFIEKYRNELITIERYEIDDLSTYLISVNNEPLLGLEEEIFWTLLPETTTIYEDNNKEVVKLNLNI